MDCDPLTGFEPAHAPDAVHAVALVADQVNVELEPLVMLLGLATSVMTGADEFTDTVADCDALPPDPEHVSVNVELALTAPVDCEPLNALPPDHAPEAVQVLGRTRRPGQRRGLARIRSCSDWRVSCTTGGWLETVTVADCVADPPGPVQVSSYSVVLVSAPVDHVPLSGTAPLHPSDAGAAGRIRRIPSQVRTAADVHRRWRGSQGHRGTRYGDIDVDGFSCRAP